MSITYPTDFLQSSLRPGELYQLVIGLGLDIAESDFRSIVQNLNRQFVSPRVIFSAVLQGKETKVSYSTADYGMSQREIVTSLTEAFSAYGPEIIFEESPGEVPQGIPLISPKRGAPLFSLDWLKQGYEEIIKSASEKTGLPRWSILPIGGSILVMLIVALKAKPVIVLTKH